MYSQRIDAINNEGIIICCRPYVDFETGESKLREIDPKYVDVIRKRYWKFKTGSEEGWQEGTKAVA